MFGSNAFGALGMDSDQATAGPSRLQVDGPETDADWIRLVRTNHDAVVRVSDKVDLDGLPHEANLMAVSNTWDLLVVGGNQDIRIYRLSELHRLVEEAPKDGSPVASPLQTIALPARPIWVRFALNDERLVVVTAGGAGTSLWRMRDVLGGNTSPYHTFTSGMPSHLVDVLPNPSSVEPYSRYVALLGADGFAIADIEANSLSASSAENCTCASWSAKGKQIAIGAPSGTITQYTPEGSAKAGVPSPPDLPSSAPTSIQWLENDLFLVSYAAPDAPLDDPLDVYIIHRKGADFTYTKFFDPLNTMGVAGRSGMFRFYASLKGWGDRTKHLSLLASGLASEVALMHGTLAPDGSGAAWEVLLLEETARGVLPAAKAGQSDDTSVIGLALDLTSDKPIKQGIVSGIEQPDLPPAPRLLVYSQDGVILSFDVQYPDAGPYPGMIQPQDLLATTQGEVSMEVTAATTSPALDIGGSGSSNVSTTPSQPPSTGFSGFGQSSTPAFGVSSIPSAFGSTSPASTLPASTIPAPAFGSSAFGQVSTGSAFSRPTFGQSSTSTTAPATGSTPTTSTQSTFGQTSKPGSTGFSAFGASTSSPSAFGASTSAPLGFGAFGSAKPAASTGAFGTSFSGSSSSIGASQTPAFGSSGSKGAFGSGSAFGSSAFGASSSPSTSKPAFAGFGSGSSSAFSGFGPKSSEAPKTAFRGFGSAASNTSSSSASQGDFGLGSFASALEPSAGLPNTGPSDSPPDSPVFGAAKKLNVPDDDDSPPGSPVPSAAPVAAKSSASASVSSSFIKPATAFSGVTSGGFGAFGQAPATQPSTTQGTPTAFASPAPTTSSSSAFGSAAFGTPSTASGSAFGQPPKPAGFGTGFGQSSKPVGFGKPSAPSAPAAFGSISGGFGGFAAKPSGPQNEKSAAGGFGGFGGFAAKATPLAFGNTGDTTTANKPKSIFDTPASSKVEKPAASPAAVIKKPTTDLDKSSSVAAEKTTLPAGYDVPSTGAQSSPNADNSTEVKPEPAPAPPGYDVPAPPSPPAAGPTPSQHASTAAKATIVPIPDEPEIEEPQSDGGEDNGGANEADWEEIDDDGDREGEVVGPDDEEEEYEDEDGDREGEAIRPDDEDEEYEDEERDFDDEDEAEEGEDEDEYEEERGAEDGRSHRRSSSGPPEMPPIKEESAEELESEDGSADGADEDEDEGHDDEERDAKALFDSGKMPKSPTWFGKSISGQPTPQVPLTATEGSPTNEPSLLSRLGPAPVASLPSPQTSTTTFFNKHAVRASSPLGQPPETAQTLSPVKPVPNETPTFSLFPPKPAATTEDPAKQQASSNSFSLFGQTKTDVTASHTPSSPFSLFGSKPDAQARAPPAEASAGFSLFPPRPAPSQPSGSLFSSQTPAPPKSLFGAMPSASAEPAKPATGLGLGKPPTAQHAPSSAPLSSTGQSRGLSSVPAPPSKPSIPLGQSKPKSPAQPIQTTFAVPSRQAAPAASRPTASTSKTIAATLEQMIQTIHAELSRVKATLEVNARYHQSVAVPSFAKVESATLSKHKALPLSTISELLAVVETVFADLDRARESDEAVETKMSELQSRMLKNDIKMGQIEKFIEAREDPSFAQTFKVTELSAEQAEIQAQLRHAVQATEFQLDELENSLTILKLDSSSADADGINGDPLVERVERSIWNVDTTLQERLSTIDELSRRIDAIRMSTPTKARPTPGGRLGTPSKKVTPATSFDPPPEVLREIQHRLNHEGAKPAWLTGLKVATLSRPGSNAKKGSIPTCLAGGPVKVDSLPLPGRFPQDANASDGNVEASADELDVKSETEAKPTMTQEKTTEDNKPAISPASPPTEASPSFGFGGIKLSLDPGSVVASPANRPSRPGGGTHRSHVPAAPFRSTSGSGTTLSPAAGFSFNLPSESPKETSKGTPSGFFSLSGFQSGGGQK